MDYGHWDISSVGDFDPSNYIGFVYIILFGDGKKYIGSKKIWRRINTAPCNDNAVPSSWRHYKSSQSKTKYKIKTNKTSVVYKILSIHRTYKEVLVAESSEQIRCNVLSDKQYLNESIATTGACETNRTSLSIAKKWQDDEYRKSMCDAQRNGKKKYLRKKYDKLIIDGTKKYYDYYHYVITKNEYDEIINDALQRFERKCANISKGLIGRVLGDSSRKKQRDAKLGKILPPEHCENIKKALTGKPKTEEHTRNAMAGRARDENGKCIRRTVDILIIDGISYTSIRSAAIQLGVSEHAINRLIINNQAIVKYKK